MNHKTQDRVFIFLFITVVLSAIFIFSTRAFADVPTTIKYSAPTHCEDGKEIGTETCTPLQKYRLSCSADAGSPYELPAIIWDAVENGNPVTEKTLSLADGDYYCRLTVSNSAGFSKWSAEEIHIKVETPVTIDPSKPKRVTNITITVPVSN